MECWQSQRESLCLGESAPQLLAEGEVLMGKKGSRLLCAEGGEDWGYRDEAVPQSETGALDGGSLTHWDLSGAGGDGGYKRALQGQERPPRNKGLRADGAQDWVSAQAVRS